MTDDELRAALRAVHADEPAPPFGATVAAARGRSRARVVGWRAVPVVGVLVAAAVVIVVLQRSPDAPVPAAPPPTVVQNESLGQLGMRTTSLRLPTDSLLEVPDQALLSSAPDLTRGALP